MTRFYVHPTPNPAKVALFLEKSGRLIDTPIMATS